jgi:hypothetical protein
MIDTFPAPVHSHASQADIVIAGRVWLVWSASSGGRTALIRVTNAIKGDPGSWIRVSGFGSGGGDCRNYADVFNQELFFVAQEAGRANLHYTYPYDAVEEATDANLALARLGASLTASIFLPITAASR